MTVVSVIQARMGSSRLPGKVLFPLGKEFVLTHSVRRVAAANKIDKVIVATSTKKRDDIITRWGEWEDNKVYRGSETNVLKRMYEAASQTDADIVVRITADCPLIDPDTIDHVIEEVDHVDYASNIEERTFPRGLDVEAFTMESFEYVLEQAMTSHQREHVTPYYHNHPEEFTKAIVSSDNIFNKSIYQDRTDLRLTLDEAKDYELLRNIYSNISFKRILPIRAAIDYVDQTGLSSLNADVEQKD
jgi:spore coat polysaccharide biosynthesis protein SpsF